MKKLILAAAMIIAAMMPAAADLPFRLHRYDAFKATPTGNSSIVFMGNSITNMHEWREAFGNDPRIVNRGNSGAVSQELIDNIETVIAGQPAKMFLLVGTNDLGSTDLGVPQAVATNIRTIIERVRSGSPSTELYVQSILPSTAGARNAERIGLTNRLISQECEEAGVTFIDLSKLLADIPTDHSMSYDRLHLTAKAYTAWCNAIAPYVGVECTYPDTASATYSNAGFDNSFGMRVTQWSAAEVTPSDILFIGDEMIYGGEWHELLGNPDIKNRGTGWGYGGIPLTKWIEAVPAILSDNPERKAQPAKIYLYAGVNAAYDGTDFPIFANHYQGLINALRKAAPATEINILSLIPRLDREENASRTLPINDRLKALAESNDNVNYIDIYSCLADPTDHLSADTTCIRDNYLYGRGYNRVARVLAPEVGGHAMSADEYEENVKMIEEREALAGMSDKTIGYEPDATARPGMFDLSGRAIAPASKPVPGFYIVDGEVTRIR